MWVNHPESFNPKYRVSILVLTSRRCGWCIGKVDAVKAFPVLSGNHLNRVPRTAVEKRAVRALANTLLAANTKIGIDFDSSERRVILVRYPKHASFDRTILDARRRACAPGATVGSDCQNARFLLARRLSVTH